MNNEELIIDVKQLNKFFGAHHVVKNLDLQVKRGEVFGFLGPNGSGKTTTIRMLCGLLTPESGVGHCLGYDIVKQSLDIKKHVGYMTQRFSFYEDLTVLENFEFVARVYQVKQSKEKIERTLEEFNLQDYRDYLTGQLSGGWKQRLALAAALLHEPQLLLLDEPTAGVDPKARRTFWEELYELSQKGITTLVSTHYMDEAARCTRLAYISKGEIITHGKISEVIKKAGLTTWLVKGSDLTELASKLKKLPGIDQIVIFGDTIHISGKDEVKLSQALAPWQKQPGYAWQQIDTELEDVFIYLTSSEVD
ncbi:MAG: ABC transporter ATP-binding protein [Gammaproteobacteria bacterium]